MGDRQNRNLITISVFLAVSKPGEELYRLLLEKMKDYCIKGYSVKLIKRDYNMESALGCI